MEDAVRAASERLRRAAKRWPMPNPQELVHLDMSLSKLHPHECFAILAKPLMKDSDKAIRGDAQEYAGRLLLRLRPASPYEPKQTTRELLSKWDVSVEQLPWYLEAILGESALKQALGELERASEITAM